MRIEVLANGDSFEWVLVDEDGEEIAYSSRQWGLASDARDAGFRAVRDAAQMPEFVAPPTAGTS